MRDLKFRCWNTAAKAMYPNDHFAITMDGEELQLMPECEHYDKPYLSNPGNMIYMQYTGLKDSKGVEIFEGDILRIDGYNIVCEVVWRQGLFGVGWDTDPRIANSEQDRKVIGNIYEHPNLLTEQLNNEPQ